jgi:hypothetical protein
MSTPRFILATRLVENNGVAVLINIATIHSVQDAPPGNKRTVICFISESETCIEVAESFGEIHQRIMETQK